MTPPDIGPDEHASEFAEQVRELRAMAESLGFVAIPGEKYAAMLRAQTPDFSPPTLNDVPSQLELFLANVAAARERHSKVGELLTILETMDEQLGLSADHPFWEFANTYLHHNG